MSHDGTRDRRPRRGTGDNGYIMITFGLFLTGLMTVAALAIDVGGWYAKGSEMQRAADAAALSGVVWMPDLTTATAVAKATTAKNGFTDGANSITVTVAAVSGNSHRLKVTIFNGNAPRYFSQMVISNQTISKNATAEYVMPLPLGSPRNTFGTGDILGASSGGAENFWAAVNGYCAGKESGDPRLARWDQIVSGSSLVCPGASSNTDYDAEGYYYTIDVPSGASGNLNVYLFDPAFGSGRPDQNIWTSNVATTTFKLYGPGPNTTEIPSGGTVLKTTTYASGSTTYQDLWAPFYSGTATAGRYFLEVYTQAGEANSYGINGFGIQAIVGAASPGNGTVGSGAAACTSVVGGTGYSASCPKVAGIDAISIFANLGGSAGSVANFYLASIDPVYAGKTMDVSLFDPGEGAQSMKVLDPNDSQVSFTWDTPCTAPPAAATGGCSGGPTTSLDVSGTGTQPVGNAYSTSKYNNRYMNLHIPLPTNYSATYGTKTWWKIQYTVGSTPTDRTTWSASIGGNPVHLVQ